MALIAILKKEIKELIKTRRFHVIGAILFITITAQAVYYGKHGGAEKLVASNYFWMLFGMISTFLALILSHDVISGERARGTLEFLLSRPISRSSILVGKFLSIFLFLGIIILGLGSFGYWFCAALLGDLPVREITEETYKGFLVQYFAVTCWISFAFLFSSLFKSPGISLATTLLLWILISSMLTWMPFGIYMAEKGGPENITSVPQWLKILFALNPDTCVTELAGHIAGKPVTGLNFFILSVKESIVSMTTFLTLFLILSFLSFRRLTLE